MTPCRHRLPLCPSTFPVATTPKGGSAVVHSHLAGTSPARGAAIILPRRKLPQKPGLLEPTQRRCSITLTLVSSPSDDRRRGGPAPQQVFRSVCILFVTLNLLSKVLMNDLRPYRSQWPYAWPSALQMAPTYPAAHTRLQDVHSYVRTPGWRH